MKCSLALKNIFSESKKTFSVMPYAAKRRLEKEKKLKKEASKCQKINTFFTKRSSGEECEKGDPSLSSSLAEETSDVATESSSSDLEENTGNTFHNTSDSPVTQQGKQTCFTSSNNSDSVEIGECENE